MRCGGQGPVWSGVCGEVVVVCLRCAVDVAGMRWWWARCVRGGVMAEGCCVRRAVAVWWVRGAIRGNVLDLFLHFFAMHIRFGRGPWILLELGTMYTPVKGWGICRWHWR